MFKFRLRTYSYTPSNYTAVYPYEIYSYESGGLAIRDRQQQPWLWGMIQRNPLWRPHTGMQNRVLYIYLCIYELSYLSQLRFIAIQAAHECMVQSVFK